VDGIRKGEKGGGGGLEWLIASPAPPPLALPVGVFFFFFHFYICLPLTHRGQGGGA
jgi:hypothetical protein